MKAKLFLVSVVCLSALLSPRAQDDRTPTGPESSLAVSPRLLSHLAFERWKAEHGDSWRLVRDDETGFGRFLYGGTTRPAFHPASDEEFALLALRAVDSTVGIHGVDSATLRHDRTAFLPLGTIGSSDKMTVRFRQFLDGAEVIGGTVNVLFDMAGRMLSLDSRALPALSTLPATRHIDATAAVDLARSLFFLDTALPATRMSQPVLRVEREKQGKFVVPRLVWEVEVHHAAPDVEPEGFVYRLDAATGGLFRRLDAVFNDVSGNVQTMATPGTAPDTAGNPATSLPMGYVSVSSPQGNAVADANGDFTIVGASAPLDVTLSYDGTWVSTADQGTSDYSQTTTLNSAGGNVVTMNSSPTEFYTAEANAYRAIVGLRDWTRSVNPSDGTADFTAQSNVNLNNTCNAYFDGVSVNFYQAGGGCVNTAYSTVVVHEMGHWLNVLYGTGNGSSGIGEGIADVFANYMYDVAIVGEDFCGTGCNIRDGNNTRQYCGDGNPGCYGEVHADGEVIMGAMWKVRTRLKNAHGSSTGGAIANLLFNGWNLSFDDTVIDSIIETHWLVLDDDDGDINNGTPNYVHIDGGFRDQGFPGFDLPFVSVTNVTELPTTADEVGPYTVNADIDAVFNPPVTAADLYWRVDGGAFTATPMTFVSGTTYTADIPGQISPAKVEYYVRGEDSLGNPGTFPAGAPTDLLKFFVGVEQSFFFEDFESGVGGWTHVSNNGAQDDWQHSSQVGSPNGSWGKSGDPTYAFSGTNIWGNDLGQNTFNGAYQDNVDNSLLSPVIDLSAASGAKLRFRRWLTIESGQYDQGDVLVNGHLVWSNPYTTDLIDTSWVLTEADISTWADGNPSVQLEWNLDSDGGVVFGGWNVDDVEIFTIVAAPPTAGFSGAPLTGVAPLAVTFADESIGNITGWAWDFGDGGSSAAQNPPYTYTTPGTYTVSLTVTGPGGSDVMTRVDYVVVDDPVPVAEFSGTPTAGIAPLLVDFTDQSTGTVTSWSWDFGDGATSTAQNPSHSYDTPGTYDVSLSVSGPGGSDALTKTGYIVVDYPPPTAGFVGSPTTGAAPLLVAFTDQSAGTITGWSWDFGDGGTDTVQHPSYSYDTPGTYSVTLTVTGPGGTDAMTRTDYIVVTGPPPTAGFSGTPTTGIAPLLVAFTDETTGTVTGWSWDFGDGGTDTVQHPSYSYATPGTYSVSLTATGPGGSDTMVRTDYIVVEDPPPVAAFSGTPTTGVAPLLVNFTDESTGTVTGWSWDFGDGGTSTAQHPAYTYIAPGTYTVSLTVSGPGGGDTATRVDYVVVDYPAPVAGFSGTPTTGVAPLLVDFTDESTGTVTGWSWDFGDGGTSTAQHPAYTYIAPGTYTVSLTVSGPGGVDTATRVDYIVVDEPPPGAEFSGTPTSGTAPLDVAFTDASTGNITSWTWDFGDSGSSAEQNPNHTYADPGTYTVSLTVSGPGGSDTVFKADYIVVQVAASSTVRNGTGINPLVYDSTTLPILGANWDAVIDGTTLGATGNSFVVGYGGPWSGFTVSQGELLLDPSSGNLFTSFQALVGGIASYSTPIPSDPIFAGFPVYTQGYLFNAGGSGQLTNAVDLVVGY